MSTPGNDETATNLTLKLAENDRFSRQTYAPGATQTGAITSRLSDASIVLRPGTRPDRLLMGSSSRCGSGDLVFGVVAQHRPQDVEASPG